MFICHALSLPNTPPCAAILAIGFCTMSRWATLGLQSLRTHLQPSFSTLKFFMAVTLHQHLAVWPFGRSDAVMPWQTVQCTSNERSFLISVSG